MKKLLIAAIALVVFATTPALAKRQSLHLRQASGLHPDCNITMPCAPVSSGPQRTVATHYSSVPDITPVSVVRNIPRKINRAVAKVASITTRAVNGLVSPLASKVAEIQSACGSKLISGVRHTKIRGTNTTSLHSYGRAADMQGNPSCIWAHLKNWEGGASNDYSRVNHYHISYGGFEHGKRFAHGGYGRRSRYAKRHGHRKHYARAYHHRRYAASAR